MTNYLASAFFKMEESQPAFTGDRSVTCYCRVEKISRQLSLYSTGRKVSLADETNSPLEIELRMEGIICRPFYLFGAFLNINVRPFDKSSSIRPEGYIGWGDVLESSENPTGWWECFLEATPSEATAIYDHAVDVLAPSHMEEQDELFLSALQHDNANAPALVGSYSSLLTKAREGTTKLGANLRLVLERSKTEQERKIEFRISTFQLDESRSR